MIQGEKVDLITLERMCLGNDPAIALLDNSVILKLIAVARAADACVRCGDFMTNIDRLSSALDALEDLE